MPRFPIVANSSSLHQGPATLHAPALKPAIAAEQALMLLLQSSQDGYPVPMAQTRKSHCVQGFALYPALASTSVHVP